MTLILAAVTRDFVILASDRRIQYSVRRDGSEAVVLGQEDTDTKSAIVAQRYVLGFAGLGRIIEPGSSGQGWRLEGWMLSELADNSDQDFFTALGERFGRVCERVNYRAPHIFVAAGFAEDGEPELITVGNSRQFPHTFDVVRTKLGEEQFLYRACGEGLHEREAERIESALHWVTKWCPEQPYPLHRRLVSVIRTVAERANGRVGHTVLVTSFPRRAVPLSLGVTHYVTPPAREAYANDEISRTYSISEPNAQFHPARLTPGELAIGGFATGTDWLGPLPGFSQPEPRPTDG